MPISIKENVSLKSFTMYKIGGNARFFVDAKKADDIKEALRFAKEKNLSFVIMGAGSNMLISDKGFNGVVIRNVGGNVRIEGEKLISDAGVMMARAVIESAKAGLGGFAWAIGIPGTIGGSVRGNAGCFGGEMKDVVERVHIYDSVKGKDKILPGNKCKFSYRHSIFKIHPEWVILLVTLILKKRDTKAIQDEIRSISEVRSKKQDLGTKSCGCIFKNVSWNRKDINKKKLIAHFPVLRKFQNSPNIPASFLIDSVELKGVQIGHVFVSPKHANYFVNDGNATAEEVVMLISHVKDVVRRKYHISLQEEIQYVGF